MALIFLKPIVNSWESLASNSSDFIKLAKLSTKDNSKLADQVSKAFF